jgi:hypothetical protein
LRVTRKCPWNRCEFCHTYKGERFSLRTVEEVKEDVDAVREIVSELKALSWKQGFGGEITAPWVNHILQESEHSIREERGDGPRANRRGRKGEGGLRSDGILYLIGEEVDASPIF